MYFSTWWAFGWLLGLGALFFFDVFAGFPLARSIGHSSMPLTIIWTFSITFTLVMLGPIIYETWKL